MNRSKRPDSDLYDLVVIGGGINGAAIARDAALRGLYVALLEKGDFGSGASSNTSKLVHGGLRYLEQFHLSLVKESLHERDLLLKNAPHLVHPKPFLVPVYAGGPHYLSTIRFGLMLYDFLGGAGGMPKHVKVDREYILKTFPSINPSGLKGGCIYYDGQMDDARLVLENVLSAEQAGATVLNYTRADSFSYENGRVAGVNATDLLTGERKEVRGSLVVSAMGAWTGRMDDGWKEKKALAAAPTKGVHLVIDGGRTETALLLRAPQDGRVFFVIPWAGKTLIGTTDTYYKGDPDETAVAEEDKNYLLEAYNAYFPKAKISGDSILSTFAGLRPLVKQGGGLKPSDVNREHVIEARTDGLITILGGKYTTYRAIAEEVVDKVVSMLPEKSRRGPCVTAVTPLPGAQGHCTFDEARAKLMAKGLPERIVKRLVETYGVRSLLVAEYLFADPSGIKPISASHPYLWGEVDFAVREEHARNLSDWLYRRSKMGYGPAIPEECMRQIAERISQR